MFNVRRSHSKVYYAYIISYISPSQYFNPFIDPLGMYLFSPQLIVEGFDGKQKRFEWDRELQYGPNEINPKVLCIMAGRELVRDAQVFNWAWLFDPYER